MRSHERRGKVERDCGASALQHRTDRLDPDLTPIGHVSDVVAMGVDVGNYLLVERSSSAAKKAEAVRKK